MTKATGDGILLRLRKICLSLPEASETRTFGNPTFRAGSRTFCVLDHYRGRDCVCIKAPAEIISRLLKNKAFFLAPYVGQHGWLCVDTTAPVAWPTIEALVRRSYRLVALK